MWKKTESLVSSLIMVPFAIWSAIIYRMALNTVDDFRPPFVNTAGWSIVFCLVAFTLFMARLFVSRPALVEVLGGVARAFFFSPIVIYGLVFPLAFERALNRMTTAYSEPSMGWESILGAIVIIPAILSLITLLSYAVFGVIVAVSEKFKFESYAVIMSVFAPLPAAIALAWLALEIEPTFLLLLF